MDLSHITFQGPPVDDPAILEQLPTGYAGLLRQINGFVQFGGGLHIRGVCTDPPWHSLNRVWHGNMALHRSYAVMESSDIPFGQDAVGDQFILRDGMVHRLSGETGELFGLGCNLLDFLSAAQASPLEYLRLQPLAQFYDEGHQLEPGQLLSIYPPFCTAESAQGVSLRAIPAEERISFLAEFASRIGGMQDGESVRVTAGE